MSNILCPFLFLANGLSMRLSGRLSHSFCCHAMARFSDPAVAIFKYKAITHVVNEILFACDGKGRRQDSRNGQ